MSPRPHAAPSWCLLGRDRRAQRAAAELIGGDAGQFFALAQRVVWGVAQPDFVRVDVGAVLRRLEARHGACFVTHLLVAFACRARQPERADTALAQARALCTDDHPWAYLLPSEVEWHGERPTPALTEVVPDQIWRVHGHFTLNGTPFTTASTATLLRTHDDALALINPVALSDALTAEVRALGPVRLLITQGRAHSRYVDDARQRFPEARVLGSRGHLQHPQAAHLRFDGLLATPSGALPAELQAFPIAGTTADEVVVLHRPTRTLVAQDLLANNRRDNESRSFGSRLYYFAFGLCDRIGMPSYQLLLWRDLSALQLSLERIAEAPFERVTAAHWPLTPRSGQEADDFRQELRFLARLTSGQHRRMLFDFMRHQPGFLLDLLRYKRKQRRLKALSAARPDARPVS